MQRGGGISGSRRWCLAALALLGAAAAPDPAAGDDDVPLPLTGHVIVRAGPKRFVIDGKQTIPSGADIRVEAGVRIAGINKASLEVKGGLHVHGVTGTRVQIEGVDFSPTLAPDNEIHFDEVDLSGCTFAHPDGASFTGGFTFENANFSGTFSVRMKSGYLRIMSVKTGSSFSIDSAPGKGRAAEVAIRSCKLGDLTLSGEMVATVRDSETTGLLQAKDFTELSIDACELTGGLALRQGPDGVFGRVHLLNCNLPAGERVVLHRPTGPKTRTERVLLEKFWFGRSDGKADLTDKQIADRIDDGADDPTVSVKAYWQNPQERKH